MDEVEEANKAINDLKDWLVMQLVRKFKLQGKGGTLSETFLLAKKMLAIIGNRLKKEIDQEESVYKEDLNVFEEDLEKANIKMPNPKNATKKPDVDLTNEMRKGGKVKRCA